MLALLAIGGLNTVISLVYYIKVLKVMVLDKSLEEVEDRPVQPLLVPYGAATYATLLAVALVGISIFWDPLVDASYNKGVDRFQKAAARGTVDSKKSTAMRGQP